MIILETLISWKDRLIASYAAWTPTDGISSRLTPRFFTILAIGSISFHF